MRPMFRSIFFFFNDTATTEIYTLSLHDALPILPRVLRSGHERAPGRDRARRPGVRRRHRRGGQPAGTDRKSTRLNSSHANISYAVFCLKKKRTSFHTIILFPSLALHLPSAFLSR